MNIRRLLLVEDNAQDRLLTLRALKGINIVDAVDVVRDGVEALDYLFARGAHSARDAADLPSAVLLDIGLPKLSGLEVLERIRAAASTQHLPVVMLTSSDDPQDVSTSYAFGANSYVRKPLAAAEFTAAVAQLGRYWLELNHPLVCPE